MGFLASMHFYSLLGTDYLKNRKLFESKIKILDSDSYLIGKFHFFNKVNKSYFKNIPF